MTSFGVQLTSVVEAAEVRRRLTTRRWRIDAACPVPGRKLQLDAVGIGEVEYGCSAEITDVGAGNVMSVEPLGPRLQIVVRVDGEAEMIKTRSTRLEPFPAVAVVLEQINAVGAQLHKGHAP
jgi:hypothetical protein